MILDKTYYIAMEVFACLVLLLMFNPKKRHEEFLFANKFFDGLLVSNFLILFFDIGAVLSDGGTFAGANGLLNALYFIIYSINPLMSLFYAFYCSTVISDNRISLPVSLKKKFVYYFIPLGVVVINFGFCLVNLFTPVFYEITSLNQYARGPLHSFSFVLSYFNVLYALVLILINYRKTPGATGKKRLYLPLILFPIPPILGGFIQIFFMNMPVLWISIALSILIANQHIQNRRIQTDSLTGLMNRSQFIPYLEWKMRRSSIGKKLYILIMDVDNFKIINDNYGHVTGDDMLVKISAALRKSCINKEYVGRYGGDEFIVIKECREEKEVSELIERINRQLDKMAADKNLPYDISLSIGYAENNGKFASADDFVTVADTNMYLKKKQKRLLFDSVPQQ